MLWPNGIELDGPLKGVSTKGFCLRGAEGCDSYYNLYCSPLGPTHLRMRPVLIFHVVGLFTPISISWYSFGETSQSQTDTEIKSFLMVRGCRHAYDSGSHSVQRTVLPKCRQLHRLLSFTSTRWDMLGVPTKHHNQPCHCGFRLVHKAWRFVTEMRRAT